MVRRPHSSVKKREIQRNKMLRRLRKIASGTAKPIGGESNRLSAKQR